MCGLKVVGIINVVCEDIFIKCKCCLDEEGEDV